MENLCKKYWKLKKWKFMKKYWKLRKNEKLWQNIQN